MSVAASSETQEKKDPIMFHHISSLLPTSISCAVLAGLVLGCDPAGSDGFEPEELAELEDAELEDAELEDAELATETPNDPGREAPTATDIMAGDVPGVQLSGTHKFCSVVAPGGTWRDTVLVPSGWTSTDCNNFRASVGASVFQLGCMTHSGYQFGSPGGWLPSGNYCGW